MKRFTDPKVVQLLFLKLKAEGRVTKTLPVGKLAEGHTQELSPAGEILNFKVAVIPLNTILKNMIWSKLHDLRENHLALIHNRHFVLRNTKRFSNRCSMENSANVDISSFSKNLYY
jgi:hypothetical protein